MNTLELLKKYENKQPEIVFEWKDSETEAEGWTVINSLRGGAAGGGTRMRKGLDKREVESLAKTMEVKFTVAGPAIGGAKSGINFDPADPRKDGVLRRWYKAVMPLLKNYYGTGGDLNIDEIHEVIPITESLGLWHPQEGVVNGHYGSTDNIKVKKVGQLRLGVSKVIENEIYSPSVSQKFTIADMITGWGVAEAVKHYYSIWGGNVSSKKVIIQGWGNVGAAAAYYFATYGAKIVGIIDRNGGVINENGFSLDEVKTFFIQKNGNTLVAENMLSFDEVNSKIWDLKADVFAPCAASRLITKNQIERMIASGMEVISCGANVPFQDPEIFFGPTGVFADEHLSVIPDFIANCGMARVFAYLMTDEAKLDDESIFSDCSNIIKEALENTFKSNNNKLQIAKTSFEIALKKLM